MCMTRLRDDRGFTLVELLVASVVTVIVLGGAVALTSQIQNGYRRQIEDSAAEQEGRYALDWIGRYLRSAANNPSAVATTDCPVNSTDVVAFQFDPDADGLDDDVRVMTDANPPDGLFGGPAGNCTQANEYVEISLDSGNNTIVFLDMNTGGAVSTRTDTIIEDLRFVFFDVSHTQLDTTVANAANNVFYVQTRLTIRTRTIDPSTGQPATRTLSSEVRVRSKT